MDKQHVLSIDAVLHLLTFLNAVKIFLSYFVSTFMFKKTPIKLKPSAEVLKQGVLAELWVTYLRFSPSYEIARKIRAKELPKSLLKKMPEDFDKVLQVYDDFGDLRFIDFPTWYYENKRRIFGVMPATPRITTIKRLQKGSERDLGKITNDFYKYSVMREVDFRQRINLVAIPLDKKKSELMKEFSEYLDRHGAQSPVPEGAIYLPQKGLQLKGTINALKMAWLHAYMPKAKLWEIGAISGVSKTYSKELASLKKTSVNTEARYLMTITVTKLLKRAIHIAENAAYGRFPMDKPTSSNLEFDWEHLSKLLQQRKSKLKPKQEYYF